MSERTYPYDAWTLQPSFKPVRVTLVKSYGSLSFAGHWDLNEKGKSFAVSDLFPTKEAAIERGWERIHEQEAKLAKMMAGINKKRIALAKAAEAT
jgi:hypothetical protein